jgi:thiamine kinase
MIGAAKGDADSANDWRARLPGWHTGQPLLAVAELGSGSGGRVWRVTTQRSSCVYKMRSPRDVAIDRERQSALQNTAAAHGLAPLQLWQDAVSGDELAEYCAGRTVTDSAFADRKFLRRLAGRIGRLHTVAIPADWRPRADWRFDILRHLNVRLARTRNLLSAAELDCARGLLADAPAVLRELGGEQRPLALLHLDIHAGNLLDADELVLLDWDYAALGDPIWDLASMAASHPQLMLHASEMLAAAGRAQDLSVRQWQLAQSLFALLSRLWSKEHGRAPV